MIDFGAVTDPKKTKNIEPPTIIGSRGYSAPEQFSGNAFPSSDIYAVGLVAIQALTGRKPSQLSRDRETDEIIWDYLVPDVSEPLKEVIKKMIYRSHENRYQSADEVLDEINKLIESSSESGNLNQPNPIESPSWQSYILKKQVLVVGGLIILTIIGIAVLIKYLQDILPSGPFIKDPNPSPVLFSKPKEVVVNYSLKIDGSITLSPVNKYFKDNFEKTYPATIIHTETKFQGSNAGIQALCDGKIDIAASSRPLQSNEPCKRLKAIKIGLDAVVFIVKKGNNLQNLTTEEVKKIFRCEDPTWFVIYGSDTSGTKDVFEREFLNNDIGNCKNKPSNFQQWKDDEYTERVRFIGNNKGNKLSYITYAPYTYATGQKSIKMLSINGLAPENPNYPKRDLYYVYREDEEGKTTEKVKIFLGFVGSLIQPNSN